MKKNLKLTTLMIVSCAAIFAVLTFAIQPLAVIVTTDITLKESPISYVVDVLQDLFEIAAFAICFALIIFAALKHSTRKAWVLYGVYCACCAVRRITVLLMSIGSIDEFGLVSMISAWLIECCIALAVTLIAVRDGNAYRDILWQIQKAAYNSGDLSETKQISFGTVFSKKNPYLVCAAKASIIILVITVGRRVISDVDYGAPESLAEVLVMAAYYLFDVLTCTVFYAIIWLTLSRLNRKTLQ